MTTWNNVKQFAYEIGGAQFTYELLAGKQQLAQTPRLADQPAKVELLVVYPTAVATYYLGPSRKLLTFGRTARTAAQAGGAVRRAAKGAKAKKAAKASKKPPKKTKRPTKAEVDSMTWYDRAIYQDLQGMTNWNPVTASLAIHGGVTLFALAAYPWWVVYHQLAGNDPFGDRKTGEVWPLLFGNN